jgi:MFS family permease
MIATLRNGSFTRLWLGGLISLIGDWALNIGLPLYIFLLTGSILALSLTLLAASLPPILFGSLAGVFVDRWDHKRTMVVTNLLLALSLLPLLLARSADLVWIVYLVAFVAGTIEQFFLPAQNALLPRLVAEERLVSANSLISVSGNLARLVGPALGGLIAARFGLSGIVLVDAASFLLAALLIAGIASTRAAQQPAPVAAYAAPIEREKRGIVHILREWIAGLRVIGAERTLAVLLTLFAIMSLGEGVFGVLYPVYVYQALHGGTLEVGELMSAQAVGGLIGGVLVGALGARMMSRWAIGFCAALFGLIDLAIFNAPTLVPGAQTLLGAEFGVPLFWIVVGLFVAVGIPGIGSMTGMQSLLQARSPDAYRGRVFGVLGALTGLLRLIGVVIAGIVTDQLGLITVLNIQGFGYVTAGLLAVLLLPARRRAPVAIPAVTTVSAVSTAPTSEQLLDHGHVLD